MSINDVPNKSSSFCTTSFSLQSSARKHVPQASCFLPQIGNSFFWALFWCSPGMRCTSRTSVSQDCSYSGLRTLGQEHTAFWNRRAVNRWPSAFGRTTLLCDCEAPQSTTPTRHFGSHHLALLKLRLGQANIEHGLGSICI